MVTAEIYPAVSGDLYHDLVIGNGFYLWRAQAETGLVATEYLNSTSVTAKAGVLIDLPRINYDANGENGALLLEPSRANFIPYSEYFGDWVLDGNGAGQSVTANYSISPEGLQNAYRLQLSFINGTYSRIRKSVTDSYSGAGVFSVYLKTNDGSTKTISMRWAGSGNISKTITSEWQRFDVNGTAIYTLGQDQELFIGSSLGDSDVVDLSIYGAMQEAGSYATSYIPNHGTSGGVTRAADTCSVTGASDVLNDSEGVLYFEGNFSDIGSLYSAFTIGNSNNTSLVRFYRANSTTLNASVYEAGGWIWGYSLTTDTTQNFKVALQWSANVFNAFVNGVKLTGATDQNSFTLSQLSKVNMGNESMAFPFHGNVKELVVLNEALSDSELATLTTL